MNTRIRLMMQRGEIEPPLPQEYQAVEYIRSINENTFILTNLVLSWNTIYEIEFEFYGKGTLPDVAYLFSQKIYSYFSLSVRYRDLMYVNSYELKIGNKYKAICGTNNVYDVSTYKGYLYSDGSLIYEHIFNPYQANELGILCSAYYRTHSNPAFHVYGGTKVKLYSFIAHDFDNKKIYKFVPCYKKDNPSVGGLYELYTGVFYTSNGSEDFGVL